MGNVLDIFSLGSAGIKPIILNIIHVSPSSMSFSQDTNERGKCNYFIKENDGLERD